MSKTASSNDIWLMPADAAELSRRDVANAHSPIRYGRWLSWLIVGVFLANFAWIVARNENFGWPIVAEYFFAPTVMKGLSVTLGLTVVAMVAGTALGLVLAVMRMSNDRLLGGTSHTFIWFFRGTPLLVQLIFWYNLSTLFPQLSISIPFGPTLFSADTNDIISPMTAAMLGLTLNEAAYMAEIVRAGLLSVDKGQEEASVALGMSWSQTMTRVILPQAMKNR